MGYLNFFLFLYFGCWVIFLSKPVNSPDITVSFNHNSLSCQNIIVCVVCGGLSCDVADVLLSIDLPSLEEQVRSPIHRHIGTPSLLEPVEFMKAIFGGQWISFLKKWQWKASGMANMLDRVNQVRVSVPGLWLHAPL